MRLLSRFLVAINPVHKAASVHTPSTHLRRNGPRKRWACNQYDGYVDEESGDPNGESHIGGEQLGHDGVLEQDVTCTCS